MTTRPFLHSIVRTGIRSGSIPESPLTQQPREERRILDAAARAPISSAPT